MIEKDDLFSTSPESILIVNRSGLKRLKCPFTVLLICRLEGLEEGETYQVRLVLPHAHFKIVYVISGQKYQYPYYYPRWRGFAIRACHETSSYYYRLKATGLWGSTTIFSTIESRPA
jgi:hypothetical protein